MNKQIESEFKLLLTKEEYQALLPLVQESVEQTNYYFDDEDYSLSKGCALSVRLRRFDGYYELTVKRNKGKECDAMAINDEYTEKITTEVGDSLIQGGITPDMLKGYFDECFVSVTLRCIGNSHTERGIIPIVGDLVGELDKTQYLGVTDYELECECPKSREAYFLSWLDEAGIPQRQRSLPKSKRFLKTLLNRGE